VEATFGAGAPAPATASLDAFARVTAAPDPAAVAAALAGSPSVAAAVDRTDVLALATLGGGSAGKRLSFGAALELDDVLLGVSAFDSLVVGFAEPALTGKVSLRVTIVADGESVLRARVRPAAALADLIVSLDVVPSSLRIAFEAKTNGAAAAAFGLVVGGTGGVALAGVPEPRVWLVLLALVLLVRRATR
jgi:hypothetical protein